MEPTKHLQIIYDRLSEMEQAGKQFGLQIIALFPNRELQITGKISGLDALKNAIKKAKEIEASAVRIEEYNTPGDRSKKINEEIVPFSRDFLMPEKRVTEEPVQHKTLIDSPDKIEALSTLGGIEGVISITSQLSQKDNQIALLKSEHRYELDKAKTEADSLRERLLDKIEEIDKLKKELEEAQNHKKELDKKSEELSGLEKKLAPREMINSVGSQVLTNLLEKMIQKNPKIAGLMGLDGQEEEEPTPAQTAQAEVNFEEEEPENEIHVAANEIAKFLKQFKNEQTIRNIIKIIEFVQEIPERHTVILNAIRQYVSQINHTENAESDNEDQD